MKKLKTGLIHATMNSVGPIHEAFFANEEDVDLVNFMDEGLIYELNETNEVTTRMIMRLSELAGKAIESNVDAILFTCSSFTPYVPKIAKLLPVPVLSSDRSMLEKAVLGSTTIHVIATVQAAGPTTKKAIQAIAQEKGKDVIINVQVIPEAFEALQRGDHASHDQLIHEAIRDKQEGGIIVLAQYSMTRAITHHDIQFEHVLTGPRVSVDSIIKLAKGE